MLTIDTLRNKWLTTYTSRTRASISVYLDPPSTVRPTTTSCSSRPKGASLPPKSRHSRAHVPLERAFDDVMNSGNGDVAEMLRAFRLFLKENDMMAYLTMMAVRQLELSPGS